MSQDFPIGYKRTLKHSGFKLEDTEEMEKEVWWKQIGFWWSGFWWPRGLAQSLSSRG